MLMSDYIGRSVLDSCPRNQDNQWPAMDPSSSDPSFVDQTPVIYEDSDTEAIEEPIPHRNPEASTNRSGHDRVRPPEQTQQAGANEDGRERDEPRAPRPLNPEAPRFPTPPSFRKAPRYPPGLPRRPELYHPKVPRPISNPRTNPRFPPGLEIFHPKAPRPYKYHWPAPQFPSGMLFAVPRDPRAPAIPYSCMPLQFLPDPPVPKRYLEVVQMERQDLAHPGEAPNAGSENLPNTPVRDDESELMHSAPSPEGRSLAADKRQEELKFWVRWCDEHAEAVEEKVKEYTSAINAAREKFRGVNWEEMSKKGLELRLDQPGFRDQYQLRQGLQEYEEERVWLGQAKGRLCSELDKALIEDWEARREMEPTPKL
ncbi:hypothetical protein JOL62DRAFT_169058 [Phyllosticta paracitricarpa]|uniref:Uncharacterized protein n=1 Tax=Phyllosticta paracitricarpa TaxID=2016321 RepID=A0ABR1N4Q6_9PEZI